VKISIIILTKNAGEKFKAVLDGIFSQTVKCIEVLVIDSISDDNTIKIAETYPVRIIKIDRQEFGHGKTRNFGANLARGSHVVFLTQDAIPVNENWLKELTNPFKDPNVVGVYGRQIPKQNENIIDKFFYLSLYSNKSIVWRYSKSLGIDTVFSDVNSAIKKNILIKNPFDNKIIVSEDHEWAHRILKKDYTIYYNPKAAVVHSHSYDLKSLFKRHFDVGVSYKKIKTNSSIFYLIKKGVSVHHHELRYIVKNGYFYLVPYCILKDFIKFIAIIAGKNEKLLPKKKKIMFSNYKYYWI
jgi:rhamnosyltransferase